VLEEGSVALVGVHGGEWYGAAAGAALRSATIVVGTPRHLAALPPGLPGRRVELAGGLGAVLDQVAIWRLLGERVAVVASGDPGFFGLARLALARLGSDSVAVHPAPPAVALAFARAGMPWDDAVVVSAHGRPAGAALEAVARHPKVAVLVSPELPPEALGRRLLTEHAGLHRRAVVATRLGEEGESMWSGDVEALAAGRFDPVSVVIFAAPPAAGGPGLVWGADEALYAHRDGMITKAEVRAVALGKLRLPAAGVLWDVGAGSGSVAAECARLAPGLRIFAVERSAGDIDCLRANLDGTGVMVVHGEAPDALAQLPDPDRLFVGGGGLDVLDAGLGRLRAGGAAVATFAALDRAAAAAARLGHLVQVAVSRGAPIGETGSWRLAADNPVFVCWGPDA
jgi:precorrin-6Y C5,15-methyltransferase (decarboxylating)